jgi:hypothetical protein
MKIQEINSQIWQQEAGTLINDNFFQQPRWLDLVSSEFGLTNHYLRVILDDDILLLCVQTKNDVGYSNYIGYGGPVSHKPLTMILLNDLILNIEKKFNIKIARMKLFPDQTSVLMPLNKWKMEHASVLSIYPGWEEKLKKQTKYSIKYSIKNGAEVRQINTGDLDRFYEIYQENMNRVKSSYKTPRSLFNKLFEFTNVCFIGAFIDGNLEAFDIFLNQGERSSYWWGTSTLLGRKYNVNYPVLFSVIKELQRRGVKVLDMASSNNQGISNFKAQWDSILTPFLLYQNDN